QMRKEEEEGRSPGDGMKRARTPGAPPPATEDPARREKPRASRATALQLEEFRKNVDRKVLQDAKMSPEEFRKFLRDYADLVKRKGPTAGALEKLPDASRGSTLPSMGGGRIKPTGTGKPEDLKSEGRALPPPGYRKAHADFLRRVTEQEK